MRIIAVIVMLFVSSSMVHADLVKKTVEYKDGDALLEGYLVYDNASQVKRPGILVVHEWMGLNDYAKSRADQLAQLGYVAFAADIYGKGIRPSTPAEAGAEAGKYKSNRPLLRERVLAGLDQLKAAPNVNTSKLAAIGYCFGGTAVLELARAGADISDVVSFHGGLSKGDVASLPIKARILALHGADDPFVTPAEVADFEKEMASTGTRYQLIKYPGAVHGFTNPNNTGQIPGALYNAAADKASWEEMKKLFKEDLDG